MKGGVLSGLVCETHGFLHAVSAHCWGAHQFRHSFCLLSEVHSVPTEQEAGACGFVMELLLGLMVLVAGAVQLDGNSTVHGDSSPNGSTAPTAPAAGREPSLDTFLLNYVRMNGFRLKSAMGYFDHPQRRLLLRCIDRPLRGGLSRRKDGMRFQFIPICDPRRSLQISPTGTMIYTPIGNR